jgi:hypothetical protein
VTDGASTKLCKGVAALLHAAGVVTYTSSGPVPTSTTNPPVYIGRYPDQPDVCAALTTYAAGGDEPTLSSSVVMLQVRTRGTVSDHTAGDNLDDAIAAQLMGHYPVTLDSGVRIEILTRSSGSPIGLDAAGRMERTTNYRVQYYDPGPYRG